MKVKVIGSHLCKDTIDALKSLKEKKIEVEFLNISESLEALKEYLFLRDNEKIYVPVKKNGSIGIPCFIKENGEKTLDINEVK